MSGSRHQWHRAWDLLPAEGLATHAPTGLKVRFVPQHAAPPAPGQAKVSHCCLPAAIADRRTPHQAAAGGPNAAGVRCWDVWCPNAGPGSPPAALAALEQEMPPHDAGQALARLLRQAGELWLYRVRLDRERPRKEERPGH